MASGQLWHFLHHLRGLLGPETGNAPTDGDLLDRFARQGDEGAFADLMRRHGPMVLAVCRRLLRQAQDAEDAFQATFLVLARKAGAIRKRESVGSWLYGTAYRVALKTRESTSRRRDREQPFERSGDDSPHLPECSAVPPENSELERHELRAVLDEEMQRLPEKYRAPLVLCYLEGKTNEQAARELSWTKGTVSGRLARARDLLRERLSRRGLALSSAVLAGVFSEQMSVAAVPAGLASSTIKTATLFAAGELVPVQVAVLAERALQTMTMTKLKMAAGLVLAVATLGFGAGLVGYKLSGSGVAVAVTMNETKPVPEKRKTDPPNVPLELKLVAKKDTYTLDLGGKTSEEFRKDIEKIVRDAVDNKLPVKQRQDVRRLLPAAPDVDLVMEIINTGKVEQAFEMNPRFDLDLRGPGAVARKTGNDPVTARIPAPPPIVDDPAKRGMPRQHEMRPFATFESKGDGVLAVSVNSFMRTAIEIMPVKIKLGPGEKHIIPLNHLTYGSTYGPHRGSFAYWTKPNEYTLTAAITVHVGGDRGEKYALTSNAVALKVAAPDAKPQGKVDPPGVPLELKLVAKKDTYTLDLEEPRNPVRHQDVNLALEIVNTGKQPLAIWIGGDSTLLTFDLQGPGAENRVVKSGFSEEKRASKMVQLAPGQKYELPITALQHGYRLQAMRSYWTKPGDYTLTATYRTGVSPTPKGAKDAGGGYGYTVLTSNTVKLKVVPSK